MLRRELALRNIVRDERRVALDRFAPTAGSAEYLPEHVAVPVLSD